MEWGWLLACLFAILWRRARRRLKRLQVADPDVLGTSPAVLNEVPAGAHLVAYQHLYHLLVLTKELARLQTDGTLEQAARYAQLSTQIDTLQTDILRHLDSVPQSPAWQQARAEAWTLLGEQPSLHAYPRWEVESAPLTSAEPVPLAPWPVASTVPIQPAAPVTPPATAPPDDAAAVDYAWEPTAPSALERALHTVAGWPAILAPFLVQNIGWFVGGLCFVAGSVFLVTYTSGFTKTLTSFAVLALYTLLLLYGGYQIRRRHPTLALSGNALLILGMLLVPLNVTAAVRLLLTAQTSPGLLMLGLVATGLGVSGVYVTATLVSGILERTLQHQHPRVFLALAAVQLAVPVLGQYPTWPVLMFCHAALLALLAYGGVVLWRLWLNAVVLERQQLASYAAGTLVYAALVSFVHVTWGTPVVVPQGYYGPWLMALCGLLFYMEVRLQPWRQQVAVLSYLSFGLYGMSIIALLLALGSTIPLLGTLGLAVLLYGLVTWQYATLPPLYLLLGCVGWLYHAVVLQSLPYDCYVLGSLPGYAAFWAVNRWGERRQVRTLALVGYRVLVLTLLGVTTWSLVYAQPGWLALTTTLLVMAGAFWAPTYVPAPLWRRCPVAPEVTPAAGWIFLGTALGLVAVAYAPPVPGWPWVEQSVWLALLLVTVWIAWGLRLSRVSQPQAAARSVAFLNSALMALVVCSAVLGLLAFSTPTSQRALPLLLGGAGGLLLWPSLVLGARGLFYGALGLWGAAMLLAKLTYLTAPGSGITTMGLVWLLWGVLWWLERTPDALAPLRQERAALRAARAATLTLLWCYPVTFATPRQVVQTPLRQTMVLVWSLGVALLGRRLLGDPLGWSWVLAAGLGTGAAGLLTGSLSWPWLLPVAITLGLGTTLVAAGLLGLSTVASLSAVGTLYATLVWCLSVVLLGHPMVQQLARVGRLHGERSRLEPLTHHTVFALIVLCIGTTLVSGGMRLPSPVFLLTLATATAFWAMAGQRYQKRRQRYLALESGVLALALGASWGLHVVLLTASWPTLLMAPGVGLISVGLSVGLWSVAWMIHRREVDSTLLSVVAVQMAGLAALQAVCLLAPALTGASDAAGVFTLAVLGLAGLSLLGTNHRLEARGITLMGLMCLVLAGLGMQSLWWHGTPATAFWLGQPRWLDQWGMLALMAGGLASLAQWRDAAGHWQQRSRPALYAAAYLTYGWALLGVGVLCVLLPWQPAPGLLWVCGVLALGVLPLSQTLPHAVEIRGAAMAVLLSAGVVGELARTDWYGGQLLLLAAWAYTLWLLATLVLPRVNALWPVWSMAPTLWPWLGLLLLGSVFLRWGLPWDDTLQAASWRLALALSAVAPYFFLLLRTSAWGLWPWLAVGALTGASVASMTAVSGAAMSVLVLLFPFVYVFVSWKFMLGLLLWSNILLLGITAWRRYGAAVTRRLVWHAHDLSPALLGCSVSILCLWLLSLTLWNLLGILVSSWGASEPWTGLAAGLLGVPLVGSWLHVVRLSPTIWSWHGSLAALGGTLLALWLSQLAPLVALPLFLALWSVGLILLTGLGARRQWPQPLQAALALWSHVSPMATIGVWLFFLDLPFAEHLGILALLGVYAACRGWQRQQPLWWFAALLAGLLWLHGGWCLWLPPHVMGRFLPWHTLQLVSLTWLVLWATRRCPWPALTQALGWLWPLLASEALLAWGAHVLSVVLALQRGQEAPWLFGAGEAGVGLLAVVALMAVGIVQARQTAQACWVYGVAVLGATMGLYGRVLWLGLVPVQMWDTVALIGTSYALFGLQRLVPSAALVHMVLLLPLLAVLSTVFHPTSLPTSAALLTVAVLYLGLQRTTGRVLPLYLGLLTFNVSLYLWVPGWARASHMLQMYTVPAAISVLWLLHAHRFELRPAVLHRCRLAASSVLYVSATLDVFLRADVTLFLVALGLSLLGIVMGIALRTRAFLYAGVSFFVLNVAGQFLVLFPEQRLTRAIVLLVLGTLITGGMIWFNIQRESLLRRLRLVQTDLTTWS